MLARENRGRRNHRDLFAANHRGGGRAQRNFGLAKTDLAADQPIHRPARPQIAQHRGNRAGLVGRLGIGEAARETLIGTARRVEDRRGAAAAFCGECDQPLGGGREFAFDFGAALMPTLAIRPIERTSASADPYRLILSISCIGARTAVGPA